MKELIVIIGSLLLGCLIFDMIVGNEESLKKASERQMSQLLEWYQE